MTIDRTRTSTSGKKTRHDFSGNSRSKKSKNDSYHQCFQKYFHSYQYLKPNPTYVTGISPLVKHWQLRDLIKFDSSLNSVLYTHNDSINRLDLGSASNHHASDVPLVSSRYCKFSYCPSCFNHNNEGLVVTGGILNNSTNFLSKNIPTLVAPGRGIAASTSSPKRGLFSFYNPELEVQKTVRFGEMINNDVTIYRNSSSSYDSYVCNNDSNLYCLDISNRDTISISNKINCEVDTCLNNVVRNPVNSKILTVAGDSSSIFLVDPSSSSAKINTIETGHASGFGISYHGNGHLFSVVFEDGTCLLYDLRNIKNNKPLISIKSTRPGHQSGGFRVSKFSPKSDMNDLLVISEHVGRVHVIDLRNLDYNNVNEHQVIVVPFALDQYGEYKNQYQNDGKAGEDPEEHPIKSDSHHPINVYSDRSSYLSFTAPLVYDYDYLVNVNPQLFKDYFYTPPPPPPPQETEESQDSNYLSPPKFNYPQWNGNDESSSSTGNPGISPTSSQRPSFSYPEVEEEDNYDDTNPDIDAHLQYVYDNLDYVSFPSRPNNTTATTPYRHVNTPRPRTNSADTFSHYSTYCEDPYQQSNNHIHGEMELAGVEFCSTSYNNDSKILVGCQDAGILMFDINGIARRSFGSYEYM